MLYHPITSGPFLNVLFRALTGYETPNPRPHDARDGKITIGPGFQLTTGPTVLRTETFGQMGLRVSAHTDNGAAAQQEAAYLTQLDAALTAGPSQIGVLDQVMAARAATAASDPAFAAYIGTATPRSRFAFSAGQLGLQEMEAVFQIGSTPYVDRVYRKLGFNAQTAPPNFNDSWEKLVLVSLAYNGLGAFPDSLTRAVKSGNRAEAWFAIRYESNYVGRKYSRGIPLTSKPLPNNDEQDYFNVGIDRGWAKRRFSEATLFGLYDNPSNPSVDEAKSVFGMLHRHRNEILLYERIYGASPDGSPTASRGDQVAAAQLAAVQSGATYIVGAQTLLQALDPAKNALIAWINASLPAGETPLLAANWNAAGISYNDPSANQGMIDMSSLDNRGNGIANNVVVGNDNDDNLFGGAGNDVLVGGIGEDYLVGGQGDDTLYGGEGLDTYVIDLRDGVQHDRIVDSDGQGRILVIGQNGEVLNTVALRQQGTTNSWTDSTGVVVIGHNSPWRLTLSDGSTVELGEDFNAEGFGIDLKEEVAPPINTFVGDFRKRLESDGQTYAFDSNGNYVPDEADPLQPGASDVIRGTAGADSILGLDGNDGLSGGGGDDQIEGGAGDDLILGGLGGDILKGGEGSDYIFGAGIGGLNYLTTTSQTRPAAPGPIYTQGFSWVTYDSGFDTNQVDVYRVLGANASQAGVDSSNQIDGGGGNDLLLGGSDADEILGGDGNDTMQGLGGGDFLSGEAGNDRISGDGIALPGYYDSTPASEQGDDVISGGAGNDTLLGQGGNDEVYGGADDDEVYGDHIDVRRTPYQNHGDDYLDGGDGNDTVYGGGRDDTLYGGAGNDRLAGDDSTSDVPATYHGRDYLDGEDGTDALYGGGREDTLYGGSGDDTLFGDGSDISAADSGADYLDGEDGNDMLIGGMGGDTLFGGAGDDQLEGDDVLLPDGQGGDDNLSGEDGDDVIYGQGGNDTLFGDSGNDVLVGGAGNDFLDGGDGIDILSGGAGDDTLISDGYDILDGGEGNDSYFIDSVASGSVATLNDAIGVNSVYVAGAYVDAANVFAQAGQWFLSSGDGGIVAALGEDASLSGLVLRADEEDSGASVQSIINRSSSAGLVRSGMWDGTSVTFTRDVTSNQVIEGGSRAEWLEGGSGIDRIIGGGGNDRIDGGAGADALFGGEGDDVLNGDQGGDGLYGGEGNDTLIAAGGDYLDGGAGDDTYLITIQAPQLIGGVMTHVAPLINDIQGLNTIVVEGVSINASETRVYSQAGTTYLSLGGGSRVALGPNVDLNALRIQDGAGVLHSLRSLPGVDPITGRVQSAIWLEGTGLQNTQSIQVAQSIQGSSVAEDVLGGSGDDRLDAGAGDDFVAGNAGNDELIGGDGADTLAGGAGSDTYRGGRVDGTDTAADVYRFNVGDGTDWIELMPAAGGTRDVIEFGDGITLEDLEITNELQDISETQVQIAIRYGESDTVVLSAGGEGGIEEIRFADGTSVSMAALLNLIPPRAVDPTRLTGTTSDDVLEGTEGDDRLAGGYGNDTLIGDEGRDWLIGGAGSNTYRFDNTSGNDLISYSAGETATLEFAGVDVGTVTARLEGDDLVIAYGDDNFVRISDYAFSSQLANSWRVQFDSLAPLTLGQLLQSNPATQAASFAQRQEQFLGQQLWQLGSTAQRHAPFGAAGPAGVIPNAVQQVDRAVEAGQQFEFNNYLQAVDSVSTRTARETTPIHQNQPVLGFGASNGAGSAGSYVPVPLNSGGYIDLPQGAVPIYNNDHSGNGNGGGSSGYENLIGYFQPTGFGGPSSSPGTQIIGWQTNTYTYSVVTANDTVVQTRLTGTQGDDVIMPGPQTSQYPVLFRGSIETGEGNDFIYLGSGQNGAYAGPLSRYEDWQRLPAENYVFQVSWFLNRGLGAWIDAGVGNDAVVGTDGNDFIIGGTGSDFLDGQAGADTYYIGVNGNDVDRIADLAEFDWANGQDYFIVYGGDLNHPNRDTVEFDDSVSIDQLSYRWRIASSEGPGYATLEFFHEDQLFLQVDYRASAMQGSGPSQISDPDQLQYLREISGLSASEIQQREVSMAGAELFKFSDGTVLSVGDLLSQLPRLPDNTSVLPPSVQSSLEDLGATEDAPFNAWVAYGFSDPQGQVLTFGARLANGTPLPEWMQFDSSTGYLSGTPDNDQVGTLEIVVTATNESGQAASDTFNLTVANVNDAPEVVGGSLDPVVVDAGTNFSRTIDWFQDADVGDTLTLSVALNSGDALPSWIQFNADTRSLSAVPPPGTLGETTIRVTATDGAGASVTSDLVIDVRAGTPPGEFFAGGAGNDTLQGGAGNDTLNSGAGDDVLEGGAGADHLFAGSEGNNTFLFGRGDGQDRVHFDGSTAGGTNTLQFKAGVNPGDVVLRRGQDTDLGDSFGALEVSIAGTADTITFNAFFFNGTAQNEFNTLHQIRFADGTTWDLDAIVERVFSGTAGNDTLFGLPGADLIDGGGGDDVLWGRTGNDTLRGGSGDDTLRGESGEDVLDGGAGADHLHAGEESNNTFLFGRSDGQDRVHFDGSTAGGTNTLQFKAGVNPGEVVLRRVEDTDLGDSFGALEVSIAGTADTITFNAFFFNGTAQNEFNTLHQIRFADGTTWDLDAIVERVFSGTAGNDTLFGLPGADLIDGGGGDDVLWGRTGNDTLRGGSGDDTLRGESGEDVLDGGVGADHLHAGEESSNRFLFGRGDGQDRVHFDGLTAGGTHTLQFKAGVNPGDVVLRRVEDTDLGGSLGALEVAIVGTTDTISFNAFFFNGSPQNEFNTLHQIGFADGTTWDLSAIMERVFTGTDGDDVLIGLQGSDTLDGGAGNDTLNGGAGADVYRFARGYGEDTVLENDSTAGVRDSVQFAEGIVQADLTYTRLGDNLEAAINGTADKLVFQNWYLGDQYHVEDFRFNDGSVLTDTQVQGLVSAMAGFSAPAAATTSFGPPVSRGTPSMNLTPNALM